MGRALIEGAAGGGGRGFPGGFGEEEVRARRSREERVAWNTHPPGDLLGGHLQATAQIKPESWLDIVTRHSIAPRRF